jgi:hypothetical protein
VSVFSWFSEFWPVRLLYEKKTAELVLDDTAFRDDETKVISVWRWRGLKTVKFLVHYKNGKFVINELS